MLDSTRAIPSIPTILTILSLGGTGQMIKELLEDPQVLAVLKHTAVLPAARHNGPLRENRAHLALVPGDDGKPEKQMETREPKIASTALSKVEFSVFALGIFFARQPPQFEERLVAGYEEIQDPGLCMSHCEQP